MYFVVGVVVAAAKTFVQIQALVPNSQPTLAVEERGAELCFTSLALYILCNSSAPVILLPAYRHLNEPKLMGWSLLHDKHVQSEENPM